MLSLLGDLASFIAAIKALLIYGALGAIAAVAGGVAARVIGGATGLLVAACLGALIVGGVNSGVVGNRNNEATIARLEHEKQLLAQQLDIELAVKKHQEKVIKARDEVIESNKVKLAKLDALIAGHEKDKSCVIWPDELEQIDELGRQR